MKIRKDIPIPEDANTKPGRPRKHPMMDMEVGDSVDYFTDKEWRSAKSAIYTAERKHNRKFCTKREYKIPSDGDVGLSGGVHHEGCISYMRVWRVE